MSYWLAFINKEQNANKAVSKIIESKVEPKDHEKNVGIVLRGLLGFLVFLLIVAALFTMGVGTKDMAVTLTSGVSIFLVFYFMAQLIERIVDPVSNSWWFGGHSVDNPQTDKDKSLNNARAASLWLFNSGLGVLLCYATVGILQVVGITSLPFGTIHGYDSSHLVDSIISGLIIGAGTKPLHDVINIFDKSGDKSGQQKTNN